MRDALLRDLGALQDVEVIATHDARFTATARQIRPYP